MTTLFKFLSCTMGVLIWIGILWDSFATIVLPRTVAPMRRLSGRFYKWSWRLWAVIAQRLQPPDLRLSFLAFFGPLSVVLLLILWGFLIIFAFALIYYGLGAEFHSTIGPVGFGSMLYMSGSTFLTLGLGDIVSPDPLDRGLMIVEAATGFIFLGLVITYMPLLDQAYSAREVGNLLLHSRAGSPPTAIRLLHRYTDPHHSEILRGSLREGERWMAEVLQSHLSHPVLAFYRAQRFGQSWLIALTIVLDTCSLLMVGGDGIVREQARLTYRMGLRLLADLMNALALSVEPPALPRLTEADLPAVRTAVTDAGLSLIFGPDEGAELVRLHDRYDLYLQTLSTWLLIPLPSWVPPDEELEEARAGEIPGASDPINV
ncbi:MAG: potassium channel family protein [Isosphaeraceae bacterium]